MGLVLGVQKGGIFQRVTILPSTKLTTTDYYLSTGTQSVADIATYITTTIILKLI
jgi:hypothetical protein